MNSTSRAPLSGAPLGPGAPEHGVKFRTAGRAHRCDSQLCPEANRLIRAGTKYARVIREDGAGMGCIEVFHPKCYDNEFDQGQ